MPESLTPPRLSPSPIAPRIAVVCHSHPSLSKGGAEISAFALYQGLLEIGVDAILICACSFADRRRLAFSGPGEFAVYYDAERYEHFYHLAPRSVEEQLVDIIVSERVLVVNFHHFLHFGLNSLRAVRALPGVDCYFTLHEFLAICHHHGQMVTRPAHILCTAATTEGCTTCFPELQRNQFQLRKDALLEAFGDFDGFISPSRFLAARYAAWGLPGNRLSVIENGLNGFEPGPRGAKSDALWTFGYFGQINPFKGVDLILEAAEMIAADARLAKSLRIRIHGNILEQPPTFMDRFAKALKHLSFFSYSGPYNSSSVYRLMADCDYIVIPSKWWENSPVVVQEAFAVKTPVICSGVGGMAEKVANGVSGLHFKLGDGVDLLRAMKAAADPAMADKLRAGIPPVSTGAEMARRYVRLFASRALATAAPTVSAAPPTPRAVGDAAP